MTHLVRSQVGEANCSIILFRTSVSNDGEAMNLAIYSTTTALSDANFNYLVILKGTKCSQMYTITNKKTNFGGKISFFEYLPDDISNIY